MAAWRKCRSRTRARPPSVELRGPRRLPLLTIQVSDTREPNRPEGAGGLSTRTGTPTLDAASCHYATMTSMPLRSRLTVIALLSLSVGAVAGCASHPVPVPTDDTPLIPIDDAAIDRLPGDKLIVPGQRVGPFHLYATVEELLAQLGPFDYAAAFTLNPDTRYERDFQRRTWRRYGISVYFAPTDLRPQIRAIFVFSPKWRTASGVGIGMLFRDAIDRIRGTLIAGYVAQCSSASQDFPAQCNAYDVDGMKVSTFDEKLRDGPLTDLWIFAPAERYTPLDHP